MARTYKGWAIVYNGDVYVARKKGVELRDKTTSKLCVQIERIESEAAEERRSQKLQEKEELRCVMCAVCGMPLMEGDIYSVSKHGTCGYHKRCFAEHFKGVSV